ncbi:Hypothetical protein, putative [Bodo saltans]|uniref:Uncharacterized protein n=1 Tax=Bodo saltans TaxID=75058 RepID=A0A0S4JDY6_BODSA|nr:Hypothetical protein, putative [Bodo saltans]|eukprot:CUG88336.1 Hypothetical protein, putative [Bodo saltans]
MSALRSRSAASEPALVNKRHASSTATAQPVVANNNFDVIQQMINDRRKEQVLRKANSERLERLDAVALEVRHRTSSGITEDMLRQKQTRILNRRGADDDDTTSKRTASSATQKRRIHRRNGESDDDCSSDAPTSPLQTPLLLAEKNPRQQGIFAMSGAPALVPEAADPTAITSATPLSAKALQGLNAFTDPRRGGGSQGGSAAGDVASLRGLTSANVLRRKTSNEGGIATSCYTGECGETASTSARSAPPALGDGAHALQGPRAVVTRRGDRLPVASVVEQDNSDDDDEDRGFENGGHICVVTTRAHELLFSGRSSSAPMLQPKSEPIKSTLAGALPVSLRAVVKKSTATSSNSATGSTFAVKGDFQNGAPIASNVRQLSKDLEEGGCHQAMPSTPPSSHQTEIQPQPQPHRPAGKRPQPAALSGGVRPTPSAEGWTNNHGNGPKSILKRHPIPRRHNRRVKFALSAEVSGNGTLLSSSSSSLKLSKDGPPVAFSLPDVCNDNAEGGDEGDAVGSGGTGRVISDNSNDWMNTVVIPRAGVVIPTGGGGATSSSSRGGRVINVAARTGGGGDEGERRGWGADSEAFNQEWGLPSPNVSRRQQQQQQEEPSMKVVRSASCTDARPHVVTRRNNSNKNAVNANQSESRRQLLSSLTFHTGLSMEEARLLAAIAEVNTKLRETGNFHAELLPAREDDDNSGLISPPPSGQQRPPPPPRAVVVAPVSKLLPANSEGIHHRAPAGGMLVVDPNAQQQQQRLGYRGNSAPPPASTSRNAPAPTQRNDSCQVVVAPQEQGLPENIMAALPKRKSEHQALTRRDRFGKKMSLVGR